MAKFIQVLLRRGKKTQVANIIPDLYSDVEIKEGKIIKISDDEKCSCACSCKVWKIEKIYDDKINLDNDFENIDS